MVTLNTGAQPTQAQIECTPQYQGPMDVRITVSDAHYGSTTQNTGDKALTNSATQSTALDVLSHNNTLPNNTITNSDAILTNGYIANGSILLSTISIQSIINKLINNNDISSAEDDRNATLIMDMGFAHFSNKMLKGNWSEVDSTAKQLLVLSGYIAAAVASDATAYLIPSNTNQTICIGKTTVIAIANALGYLSAMGASSILGKKLYTKGLSEPDAGPTSSSCKKAASGALVAAVAMATATTNRILLDSNSALSIVLNLASHEVVSKLLKVGQRSEDEPSKKVMLLASYWLLAVAADAFIGTVIPSSLSFSDPRRYFGGTTVGATASFLRVSVKHLLDHGKEGKKEKGKGKIKVKKGTATEGTALIPQKAPQEKKGISRWRALAAGVVAVATPIVAIAANHLECITQSPMLSLAVKVTQHNVNSLALRELFTSVTGTLWKTVVALAPIALATGSEFIAHAIDPVGSALSLSVTGVAVATGTSFLGMAVSNSLVRGDGDNDDE